MLHNNKRRISSFSVSFKAVCSLLIQLYYAHLLIVKQRVVIGLESSSPLVTPPFSDENARGHFRTTGYYLNGSSYETSNEESYSIIFGGSGGNGDISIEPAAARDRLLPFYSNERTKSNENSSFVDLDSMLSAEQGFNEEDLDSNNDKDGDVDEDGVVTDSSVYNLPSKIILSTLAATASIITVCGNLLVMTSFFLDRQIRNPTNYFLLSLAISDFLIGLFSIPFLTLYLMIGEWPFGQIICNLWLSLDYTVCLTSIYTVLFITIDRFCSVKMPAKYRKWRTPNKIIVMVLLTWIIPISLFFTSIFGWSYGTGRPFDPKNCDVAWADNKVFSVTLVFSYFWSTLAVIVVLYVFIYQVALSLERKSREKQRKLSSLVGASASNTGALVSVVALGVNNKKMTKSGGGGAPGPGGVTGGAGAGGGGGGGGGGNNPSNLLKNSMKQSKKSNQPQHHHSEDTGTPDDADDEDTGPRPPPPPATNSTADGSNSKFGKGFLNRKKNKTTLAVETDQSAAGSKALSNNRIKNGDRKGGDSSSQLLATTNSNQENSSDSKTLTNSNSTTTGGNNRKQTSNNNNMMMTKSGGQQHPHAAKSRNKSNASTVMTNNSSANYTDDMSSSYESHSDFDTANSNRRPLIVVKSGNTLGVSGSQPPAGAKKLTTTTTMGNNTQEAQRGSVGAVASIPQPRPESLAVMSHDTFAEKLATGSTASLVKNNQSSNVNSIKSTTVATVTSVLQTTTTTTVNNNAQSNAQTEQSNNNIINSDNSNQQQQQSIPFIDDDFDDLSYVLHRRQLEPNTKLPVKEETIIIKTPLSFLQRITTPLRSSFSRKNSISHTNNTAKPATGSAAQITNNVDSTADQAKKTVDPTTTATTNAGSSNRSTTIVTIENEASKPSSSPKLGVSFTNHPTTTSDDFSDASKSTKNKSTNTAGSGGGGVIKSTTFNTTAVTGGGAITTTTTSSTAVSTMTSRAPQPHQMNSKRKKQHENRARKALRTITFILGAFITCFAPWHIVSIYNSFCSPSCWSSRVYHHFFYSCYFLCYMNSPINPFMYALANQQFKKTFCRILKGDLRKL